MQDVVSICGLPDHHAGSGIYIFIYELEDGSKVWIGTPDLKTLNYVRVDFPDGRKESLIRRLNATKTEQEERN
ncbi:MAG: hypothetical protein ABSE63_18025 [Thermoguttaceae bacterium]